MNDRYVSDVIGDINKIVRLYGKQILIAAGVGAGKTHWVDNVLAEQGKVLYITSRKARGNEDTVYSEFTSIDCLNLKKNRCTMTNSDIENLLKQCYLNILFVSKLLERFDYIVVDEFDSIAVDSPFARSSFTLYAFIRYAVEQNKVVIGMTCSPEPIIRFVELNNWHFIDLRRKCRNEYPERITLIDKTDVTDVIWDCLRRKKRIVYFVNMGGEISNFVDEVLSNHILREEEIAVIVGSVKQQAFQDDLREVLDIKTESFLKQSGTAFRSISENKMIPDSCRLLICTSTMREGVDIRNDDVEIICENHILSSVIRLFERVRIGGGVAHIVANAKQHKVVQNVLAYDYAKDSEVQNLNYYLKHYRKRIEGTEWIKGGLTQRETIEFAETIEAGNPYIFLIISKNSFLFFILSMKKNSAFLRCMGTQLPVNLCGNQI